MQLAVLFDLSYHQVDSSIFIGLLLTRYIPYPTPGTPYLVSKQVRMRASASWQQQAEISVFLSSAIFTIFSIAGSYCCKISVYIY